MSISDLLYPKFCLGCGYVGTYICPLCFLKIKTYDKSECLYCKKLSPHGLTHPLCCNKLNIDGNIIIYKLNPFMRKIIKNVKYRLARSVLSEMFLNIRLKDLNRLLSMKKHFQEALIQPIPLSKNKYKSRGFNQAYFIAKFFSRVLGLGLADYLIRDKEVVAQAESQTRFNRYINIQGVFKLKSRVSVKNKKILLVDDVVTTGATVREACKIIKKGGAKSVYVLTLAG